MTTFLVIGLVGLVLLAISLVLGDVADGALDGLGADWFSTAVIGAFVSAFGFGGAAAQSVGLPSVGSVPVGIVAGGLFAWFAAWLTRLMRDAGSDEPPSTEDTVGRDATVLTGIPADGYGVVRVQIGGHTLRLNARAERPVDVGTAVHVTAVLSPTAVDVAPVWNDFELP